MRRPALAAAALLVFGTAVAHYIRLPVVPLTVVCGLLLAAGTAAFVSRRSGLCSLLVGLLLASAGALRMETKTTLLPPHHVVRLAGVEGKVILTGRVSAEPLPLGDRFRFLLDVRRVGEGDALHPALGVVQVSSRRFRDGPPPIISYGDSVCVRVRLERPSPARNPGAFDYRKYLERKGIYVQGFVGGREDLLSVQPASRVDLWQRTVLPIRAAVRRAVDANLAGGPAGLLKGMLLGEKRGVPESIRETFATCGVNHVLAVSGLHVGLIAAVVFFGTRLAGLGRFSSAGVTLAALGTYACVTGMPPSVIRASVMAAAALMGGLVHREADGLNVLGGAALLLVSLHPTTLFDLGFQLSFSATGAILVLHRPIRSLIPAPGGGFLTTWVAAPLSVSLAAQLGTAPLVAGTFGQLAVVSPAANLVVVPLIGVAVGLGLLSVIASVLWGPLANLLNGCNWLVLQLAIGSAEWFARPDWASVPAVMPSPSFTVAYLCGLLLLIPAVRAGASLKVVLLVGLLAVNTWVWKPFLVRKSVVEVTVLDVGQGDGVFISFPDGKTMLVDGGLLAKGIDTGERVIAPFLRHRGVRRIDAVVASHPHSDHVGGLVYVLEHFEVGAYIDSGQHYDTWTARRIRSLIQEKGIRHLQVAAGDSLAGFGGAGLLVLHPAPGWVSLDGGAPEGPNNGSVVLRLTYGNSAMLLTGDIEMETDSAMVGWGTRLRAQVLKAAHHGSRTSSTQRFLQSVGAEIVTVSCGIRNKFRHSAPEVIERFEMLGARVYRTDLRGAIRLRLGRDHVEAMGWLAE